MDNFQLPLTQLLDDREHRAQMQTALLEEFDLPLICFTLNIPGAVKRNELIDTAFELGFTRLQNHLKAHGVTPAAKKKISRLSGQEGYLAVDMPPSLLKKLSIELEETGEIGRLFDVDVVVKKGKISRSDLGIAGRKCLLCNQDAYVCGRSRAHPMELVTAQADRLLKKMVHPFWIEQYGEIAVNALLAEVYTTPKPGLVDRDNSGAHSDMNLQLFVDSSQGLGSYFRHVMMVSLGYQGPLSGLLKALRPLGLEAEDKMLRLTKGVNTHKGGVFSIGLLCGSVGYLLAHDLPVTPQSVCGGAGEIAAGALEDFKRVVTPKTEGERLYINNGTTGIRGQAALGFPQALLTAYPIFKKYAHIDRNLAGVAALLHLMTVVDDTNIVKRGGWDSLRWLKGYVGGFLATNPDEQGIMAFAKMLDSKLISLNLSPGGCADLLAVTYFLDRMEDYR